MKNVFESIYVKNHWGSNWSRSGTGSEILQTRKLILFLPRLLHVLNVKSILDLPCGDFNWMKEVDLGDVQYKGGDIVEEVVRKNNRLYANEKRSFQTLDLTNDPLPQVDLVFVRDCLVHLENSLIIKALENLKNSGSKWLLTTSFPRTKTNVDIQTGDWRTINLTRAPFSMQHQFCFSEGCTENEGRYRDKSMILIPLKKGTRLSAFQKIKLKGYSLL